MGNNTKYDDLTLMQFADGELDNVVSEQLEQDLVDNQQLQERLLVFTATREAMIGINAKLPKHIEDLIDQQDSIAEDDKVIRFSEKNPVSNFFRNHPIQSFAASVMFGLLIGSQGMQGLYTSPEAPWQINNEPFEMLQMSKNIEEEKPNPSFNAAKVSYKDLDDTVTLSTEIQGVALTYADISSDISQTTYESLKEETNNKVVATRSLASGATFEATYNDSEALKHNAIVSQFIDKLKNDSTIKEGEVKVGSGSVQLIHSFTNAKKLPCKLIEVKNQYSIICQNNDKNWAILFNNNHNILDLESAVKF